ncbi:MAG: hypothetical protein EA375_02415 [Acholeplasmataceae bacterium]|nr:MAG: hypothetical protein EA375_02415 [Acholeplasmataceae bacterium]
MKKFITMLLFGFFLAMMFSFQSFAQEEEEDIIELYPYNQLACLEATPACTELQVGSAHWTWMYHGHRYHVVRGGVRYVKDFVDADADGFISPLEIGAALTYNAFGALTINDTDETVVLSTQSGRADITSVVHRIYVYFDEDGVLQMFEDQVHNYYIFNEGDETDPDWRLATQTEIDAYIAAEEGEKPVTTRNSPIRMALDDTHTRGYVLEPLTWIQWSNADVVVAEEPDVEKWSTIIPGNPNFVTIPAGWSTFSFSTFDRGTQNPLTTAYLKTLPFAMIDEEVDPMVIEYTHQPAVFDGLVALDDDLVTPGIQIVIDYQADFDLPATVTAAWINMFDEDGKIQNQSEYLDYTVTISQDDVDLETIEFNHDGTAYVASGPVTSIDTGVFGAGYVATFAVTTPKGDVTERFADIVVGVMPPTFSGVQTRYVLENTYVDLLEDITADDGYGNDLTHSIIVTTPAGFNPYNVQAGTYEIGLSFTHNVFIAGDEAIVTVHEEEVPFNMELHYNKPVAVSDSLGVFKVWDDVSIFKTVATGWGNVIVVVAADGTMKESYSRFDWFYTTEDGTITGDLDHFTAWMAALELEEGEFVVAAHGAAQATRLRVANLAFGDPISVQLGTLDFDYDIVTETSYMLVVDDVTPPLLLVVNNNFTIHTGQFTNVNQAILSNVVAFDLNDGENVAVYVANNGGLSLTTPGAYTVVVMAEDLAGNNTSATFTVTVVQAPHIPTDQEIQDMIDAAVEDAVADLMDEIEALREELTPVDDERGCLGIFTVSTPRYSSAILPILGLMTLIGIVVFKRRF